MLNILMRGTQVWEKGSARLAWRVVGQGRHGVICRRADGLTVTTRCFKLSELQWAGDAVDFADGHLRNDTQAEPCLG